MEIQPGSGPVKGRIFAPPSKSMTQRAILFGILAEGESSIINPSLCSDALASVNAGKCLGADIIKSDIIFVNPGKHEKKSVIDCAESGFTLRAFSAAAALWPGETILTASGTLANRDHSGPEECYKMLGATYSTNSGKIPVKVTGRLAGGSAFLESNSGSQHLSGLLAALTRSDNDSELIVERLTSKPYIDMTIEVGKLFGAQIENREYKEFHIKPSILKSCEFHVEGDWGLAAPFLCAAAISGELEVEGLNPYSVQADRHIVDLLEAAGVDFTLNEESIFVKESHIREFNADLTDCPDLFPSAVMLAAFAGSRCELHGTQRLVNKESNRAGSLIAEFRKMGADIEIEGNLMIVKGGRIFKSDIFDSHHDHRIEMAIALSIGVNQKGGTILYSGSSSKSYPGFYDDFASVFNIYPKNQRII